MTSNKFSRGNQLTKTPPVCKSKKPPPPSYPLAAMRAAPGGPPDPFTVWLRGASLPAQPKPPFNTIQIRNLAYNVYANKTNHGWIHNLRQIKQRWDLFNGRRVVAIAEDETTIPSAQVKDQLGPDAEYFVHPNDPRLRETPGFGYLLRALNNSNPNEATFHAHTQGTAPYHAQNPDRQRAKRFWRNRMYHECLDDWPAVATSLRFHATAGCFIIDYRAFDRDELRSPTGLNTPDWHYSGAFFWFRHDCTYRDPEWCSIPDDPYASESWPGRLFDISQAGSLYQPWPADIDPPPAMYDPATYVDPIDDIPF